MSKIKNGGLDQYGAKPFEQQKLEQLALKGLKCYDNVFAFVRDVSSKVFHFVSYLAMNVCDVPL